jgi:ribosomal protein S14
LAPRRTCAECGTPRPPRRTPKHQQVLDTMPYEAWVERFGERCGICGRPPGPRRRLDRDHDHKTGVPRGLLCHRCNRALPDWISEAWLVRAIHYLRRANLPTLTDDTHLGN